VDTCGIFFVPVFTKRRKEKMRLQSVLSSFVLAASAAASNFRGFGEVGAQYEKLLAERAAAVKQPPVHRHQQERRQSGEKAFLTAKTESM